ncbi:MAG: Rpn family recombination-promoting nuclease/putative transposase [Lachnospiraceae bacterium]|nr:Rpn family recombination-promoting nuclease/putative transposase [Lachnospiraceae bacterium]
MAEEKATVPRLQKDRAEKKLEGCRDVFADISNVLIFEKPLIQEDQLRDGPTETLYKADGKAGYREQRRDVAKYVENMGIQMMFVGMENQSKTDRDMAIRVMGYDYASYRSQMDAGAQRYPVITAVLYFGDQEWDVGTSLKEIVDIPEELAHKFADYRINLIDVPRLPKSVRAKLTSDFRVIADYFAEKSGAEGQWCSERTLKHPVEVTDFFRAFTGDKRFNETMEVVAEMEKEGRDVRVCDLFDKAEAHGRREGRVEGHAEGRAEGRVEERARMISAMRRKWDKQLSAADAAEALELDEAEVREIYDLIERDPGLSDLEIAKALVQKE